MKIVSEKDVYIPIPMDLDKLTNIDWVAISESVGTGVVSDLSHDYSSPLFRYPGFVFSSSAALARYNSDVYSTLGYNSVATPPRGNLTKDNRYLFFGIKPGPGAVNSVSESSWLFGPSTTILYGFLEKLNLFPYFSNVYKDWNAPKESLELSINSTLTEILQIKSMYEDIYGVSDPLRIVFMGKYPEFDFIENILNKKCKKQFQVIRIWHPSYILRMKSWEKFYMWLDQYEDSVNRFFWEDK